MTHTEIKMEVKAIIKEHATEAYQVEWMSDFYQMKDEPYADITPAFIAECRDSNMQTLYFPVIQWPDANITVYPPTSNIDAAVMVCKNTIAINFF